MLHIRLCLIHKGGMRGKHLRKGLFPSQPFTREVVCSLGVVACCYDCSSIHNPDCSDYSDYYATLGLDSGSNSCCSHTNPIVVADSD